MNSKLASHKHIFFKVKVILNKVKINNPWIDFKWKVYDILPQEIIVGNNKYPATFISPEPLKKIQNQHKSKKVSDLFIAEVLIDLHRSEAEAYAENLSSSDPSIYIVLRDDLENLNTSKINLVEVSVSPYNIQDYEDSGEDQIEKIPLQGPIKTLIEEFVSIHFKPEPFVKRKRDKKFNDDKRVKPRSLH